MIDLLKGMQDFYHKTFPKHAERFAELAKGQKPRVLFITCSDSRIDPNLLTHTKPGEIFVIRNAGNIVPPYGSSCGGEEATIEYAIDGLGIKNVVICGHSHCGAMTGLSGQVDMSALPSTKAWLKHAAAVKKRCQSDEKSEQFVEKLIHDNILVQVQNLKTHPAVSAAITENRLKVFGCVYHFESGLTTIYHRKHKKFVPVTEVGQDAGELDLHSL